MRGWLVIAVPTPKLIPPARCRQKHVGKGELLLGLVLELIHWASCVCLISFCLLVGDGQVVFFPFLYHSVCFKPCDLQGCRHHLLCAGLQHLA